MAPSELMARLNSSSYKNWVKGGHCLLLLKRSLEGFMRSCMETFHGTILSQNPELRGTSECSGYCRPRGRLFQPRCPVCVAWKREILNHHTQRSGDVFWGNCKPALWSSNSWELAKAYMPRGQMDKLNPEMCDAAALLNLLSSCDYFSAVNPSRVRDVINCRNVLMHSSDMKISSEWLDDFRKRIKGLIDEFQHVPEIVALNSRIEDLLASDWAVHVPGGDQMDGLSYCIEAQIGEIEVELIKEKLQEMFFQIEEQESLSEEIRCCAEKVKTFLQENKDLECHFQADLQKLDSLLQMQNPKSFQEQSTDEEPQEKDFDDCLVVKKKRHC
uniref:Uncharacterized protein CXorf38 homolog n=1 Tax=Geotrypetes seraphini TaxID=260995 RepID=A0A6P8RWW7_GEOSA|nr:uncharacterized protein CXorf38 homolog [Geotrypetes seraphini]XP_033810143.1 uncharacterized protein CXorf38 homolog [Geotrypetes seraphini]XP_033810144.1 uncharacterized protein CXorf38 homolog [Geotrypetes seraphini]XP_033810145.1 uncharacterized protein CXorf38 homolog [Geotrypetes seraphini]XP_033810146.1 uncharacterized protein CXorf38 homolog [Geotrypetes seraphini]